MGVVGERDRVMGTKFRVLLGFFDSTILVSVVLILQLQFLVVVLVLVFQVVLRVFLDCFLIVFWLDCDYVVLLLLLLINVTFIQHSWQLAQGTGPVVRH